MEWKSGCSVENMDWLMREMGRNCVESGRRARNDEVKKVYFEVDEMGQIHGCDGEVEGAQMSIAQAVRLQLADLESQGLLDQSTMPKTLEYRFSFDGTVLSQGESLVVVAIVPINLPISCQSSASAMPVALMKCGEDREKLSEALATMLADMDRLQARSSINWHGHREIKLSQSYDMASWWKILEQSWNSNSGCCPWCNANQHNLHEFQVARDTELPVGVHARSIIPIPMENSSFCPLHAMLRVFGDSYMDHLAYYAVMNNKKTECCAYVAKVSGNTHFSIEEAENGRVSTTALQGPACKKLLGIGYTRDRDAIANLVDAAGVVNGHLTMVNDVKDWVKVKTLCRTIVDDGSRCQTKKSGKNDQCKACISKQSRSGLKLPLCGVKENPVKRWTTGTLRDDWVALGQTMRVIFPATTQVDPYYDNMYEVLPLEGIEGIDEFIVSGSHLSVSSTTPAFLAASEKNRRAGRRKRGEDGLLVELPPPAPIVYGQILHETSNTKIRGKWVKNVTRIATAEEQINKLEQACKEFGDRWCKTIGDERVTAYVHMLAAHATPLMKKHKSLGKFSNSVIEAFHKKVRFFYHRTNRQGGVEKKESAYAVMQKRSLSSPHPLAG